MRRSTRTRSRVRRFGVPAVVAGTAVIAALTSAQSASAQTIHPTGYTCRSEATGNNAEVAFKVSLDSCSIGNGAYGVAPEVKIHNPYGVGIFVCAHAINVDKPGEWAWDYKCADDWKTNTDWTWDPRNFKDLGTGSYVISAGFWGYAANGALQYFGDVQSPRINVTP
ncbi:hypothetical protein [Streptomyces sp. NPDC006012]|uniref:hypothetical protein n=1 Tax=Streptomyces sp. NPDC006012 TaxID=3364739 RepID=UPI003688B8F2